MDERLILMDGTEIPKSHALKANRGELFLYLQDPAATFAGTFHLLMDPAKTGRITALLINGTREEYAGYTELISLRKEEAGYITAILAKPEA